MDGWLEGLARHLILEQRSLEIHVEVQFVNQRLIPESCLIKFKTQYYHTDRLRNSINVLDGAAVKNASFR